MQGDCDTALLAMRPKEPVLDAGMVALARQLPDMTGPVVTRDAVGFTAFLTDFDFASSFGV